MITIIFGKPRVGKTALMTHFATEHMLNPQARQDIKSCRGVVEALNAGGFNLTVPDDHLVFSDYHIQTPHGRRTSYHVNGFRFGLPGTENRETMFFPPYARFYLDEAQKYYNSREGQTFSDHVSRAFEVHAHNYWDITIACQRPNLIDLNVRELCGQFIEILDLRHTYVRGEKWKIRPRIKRSVWTCRVFEDVFALQTYLAGGKKERHLGQRAKYVHEGDIFQLYDSCNFFPLFYRDRYGKDFDLLPSSSPGYDVESIKKFNADYDFEVPDDYRKHKKPSELKKKQPTDTKKKGETA